MLNPDSLVWRDRFVLTREIELPGERTEFFQRVNRGEFARVRRGVYLRTDEWSGLEYWERYRLRVLATAAYARYSLIFARESAAALWRLPSIGPMPRDVHALGDPARGGRSSSLVTRHHPYGRDRTETIEGVMVTSLARTVVDIAHSGTFEHAVAVADAALRQRTHPRPEASFSGVTKDELVTHLESIATRHGSARARRAIEFADDRADLPGESLSRVNIHLSRLTAPELQVEIRGVSGRIWTVDFWWPAFNLIGEFDGEGKYSNPLFLKGRTPHRALMDEKFREDDLRATGRKLTRWDWSKATNRVALRDHLVAAGLR